MEERQEYQTEEPIVALATPMAESAVAMIRTSGVGVLFLFKELFSPWNRLNGATHRQAVFGRLVDPETGGVIDEVVALVYRAPGGYTGEEAVELMCHGSLPGIGLILNLLGKNGFRQASPGEFTFRAFMNGKLDLTRAEAVHELVKSRTKSGYKMALSRLSGALALQIDVAKVSLVRAMSAIEIQLDYPGDEIDDQVFLPIEDVFTAKGVLQRLLESYEVGKLVREGVRIALCGKTNSGKSSLFNLFLKEDRSIVSDIHGTTRDYLEGWISLKGIPVLLYDTAGIRETSDFIETEGIRRARQVIDSADLILYVVDSHEEMDGDELALIEALGERCLSIWNKVDLSDKVSPDGFLGMSAVTGQGFEELISWVYMQLQKRLKGSGGEMGVVIDSQRQKNLLEIAVDSLGSVLAAFEEDPTGLMIPLDGVAVDMQEALNALGQLTGEVTSADILEQMFSNFCVGK